MLVYSSEQIIAKLLKKKIGILPTDTIYGLVTLASNYKGIARIFQIKKRPIIKKMPILVASWEQLGKFIELDVKIKEYILSCSEPTTIIYPLINKIKKNSFFHKKTIAIRFVKWDWLKKIILKTGPLAATSCNLSGEETINEWNKLNPFFSKVDFSVQKRPLKNKPSQIFNWEKKIYIR